MTEPTPAQETHRLILLPAGRQGDIPHGTTILKAAESLGVEIEAICGKRQICGKCLVSLERGEFPRYGITSSDASISPANETELAYFEKAGIDPTMRRMACVTHLLGDAVITVPEESQARKQVIRKEASALTIELDPAVRLVFVEVPPAVLGGPGDWERVQIALYEEWGLEGITIDPVLLIDLQSVLRKQKGAVTLTIWQNSQIIRVAPGLDDGLYGLAVDVGSTTVALHLCDLRTGDVLATESSMNPQVRFGEDLMSRVSFAMMEANGMRRMNRAIIKTLNDLTHKAAAAANVNPEAITDAVLVGNSVMHHVLLGIDPRELGHVPFALATQDAVDIRARDMGLTAVGPGAMVHMLPCIAGFVGADNVAVLLSELPHLDEKLTLIVDIGTNAEILFGNKDRMLSASSPTGPALEGAHIQYGQRAAPGAVERVRIDGKTGQVRYKVIGDDRWNDEVGDGEKLSATGICGSGIIEVVAELFHTGLIDSSGRFTAEGVEHNAAVHLNGNLGELVLVPGAESSNGVDILVTQKDIRAIQLAKGALYAGSKLLMEEMGADHVDRIKLAGAFGSYISPWHAMVIGMLPDCDLNAVSVAGNAAGDGARIALLNVEQRERAQIAARKVSYLETGSTSTFQDAFVEAMVLPHATDAFPHLLNTIQESASAD